jgi:hypothetical protein
MWTIHEASATRRAFRVLTVTLAFLAPHIPAHAQWISIYNPNEAPGDEKLDRAHDIRQTSDGGYIVAGAAGNLWGGSTTIDGGDCWVLKLDPVGNVEWSRTYGGDSDSPSVDRVDAAYSIRQTDDDADGEADDGYIVAGETRAFRASFWRQSVWILKLDPRGDITWAKTYGDGQARAIGQTRDGGYIVIAYNVGTFFSRVLKLDSEGDVQWQKSYTGTSGYPWLRSVEQTDEGGYIAVGVIGGSGWDVPNETSTWIVKLDPGGNLEWHKIYDLDYWDVANAIRQTDDDADGEPDDGYIVAGWVMPHPSEGEPSSASLLKLDPSGNVQWLRRHREARYSTTAWSVHQTADGGYVAAGGHGSGPFQSRVPWLFRTDNHGDIQWQKKYHYDQTGEENIHLLQPTTDGGYVVAGGRWSVKVLKLKADGSIGPLCRVFDTAAVVVGGDAAIQAVNVVEDDPAITPQDSEATVLEAGVSVEFLCETEEEQCGNGLDDDGDGLSDCDDPECCGVAACFGAAECRVESETLQARLADMHGAEISGEHAGTVELGPFRIVTVATGPFAGKGFSTAPVEITLDSATHEGEWNGVVFLEPQERRIRLTGAVSGGITAAVDGHLTESVPGSDEYDRYEAVWRIGRLGSIAVSSIDTVSGNVAYQSTTEYVDTELYVLQDNVTAASSGDYDGVLSTVSTHLRVVSPGHPHVGEGFSIISYQSSNGSGEGWTRDELVQPGVVSMKGLLGDPILGVAYGTLDERSPPRRMDLVVEQIDLRPLPDLKILTWAARFASPGQTVSVTIGYANTGSADAEDVVVILALPDLGEYVSSTGVGIYRWQNHEVFWKLGTLRPGETGVLTAQVTLAWGLARGSMHPALAFYTTSSTDRFHSSNPDYEDLVELRDYLDYQPLEITSVDSISPEDLEALFTSDPRFDGLHDHALDEGYTDLTAMLLTTSEGPLTIVLMEDPSGETWFIIRTNDDSLLMRYTETTLTFFDQDSGVTVDLDDGSVDTWGQWGSPAPPSRLQAARQGTICPNIKVCIDNCVIEKISGWLLAKIKLGGRKPVAFYNNVRDCGKCALLQGAKNCVKCALIKFPGIGHALDILTCGHECRLDPESHCCTKPKRVCKTEWFSSQQWSYVYQCDTDTGFYNPFPYKSRCRKDCDKCVNGRCVEPGDPNSASCSGIQVARDPNAKYGPPGPVEAGQRLDYKVEYENEGEGIAFGVYFTDTLDEDLDATTLEIGPVRDVRDDVAIGPPGTYDPATRTITWFAGEVGPHEGGYAELSVNVRGDAAIGTEIINFATVYFPSVPEETRTNSVVAVIPGEVCDGDIDIDGDALIGCDDPDCYGPDCPETCDDLLDNDDDGFTDCADPDCPACAEICKNGLDDDRDEQVDCADRDCADVCNVRPPVAPGGHNWRAFYRVPW